MSIAEKYVITAADGSHYDEIAALFTTPEELFLIYPSGSWPFDRAQLERVSKERSDFTVVLDKQRVIGFANLYTNTAGDRYFIGNIVVSDAYRGQGIGRRLVRHMCDLIFDHYASTVYISVFASNTAALLLYTALGFKPYDIERRTPPNGDSAALLHMRLDARSW
ncbi:MAG: GNAT family N-acetyltransferase [gamma proteobacterium symbiont of Ctena orbiculata]|nr:GNAT family N-acetyltransferase [Candidatus Thiodiazotropha taylori]MBT3059788.1 GNAT family N-acetyltransferase [Candidatus Thiodiazotropha sp. (ex Lucina pensylvanica)]MBV2095540.1 GNAT family N-acetyltransferase [Candidatus Thiodiazotropha sp. (ex Codakia orbicularis)]PUB73019.1 MAG: GNAT family N-acetyltransferase [gamma proteobacterium symbiont of Ctena orbiculata]MBT3062997.1 GNAT family N-acetyltransferase [Candidatus Thiodiazotropha sp. (ex Lucina pensylvanica)]